MNINSLFSEQTNKTVNVIGLIALGLMLFSCIATIVWGSDRGLGLGDEGVYLLSARFPDDVLQNVSAVYIYTGFLFRAATFDPASFRLLGMILILASAFVFWFGFYKYFDLRTKASAIKYFRPYSLLFIEMGAMVYYQWFFATPNNYTLTAVAVNVFAGMLLLGMSFFDDWNKNHVRILAAFFIVGINLGFAFFTKLSSGICLILLCILVVYLRESIDRIQKTKLVIAILLGIGVRFSGHFILVRPPGPTWQLFKQGWALYQSFGVHVPKLKTVIYSSEILYLFYSSVKVFFLGYIIVGSIFAYSVFRGQGDNICKKLNSSLLIVVVLIAIASSARPELYIDERTTTDKSIPFYVVFHLAWVSLFLAIAIYSSWYKKSAFSRIVTGDEMGLNSKVILALLIVLPIAGAIGTANPIFNVTGFYSAPWFGAIILLILTISNNGNNSSWLMPLSIFVISAFTSSQIIQGSIFDPQQIQTTLYQQAVSTDVGFPSKTLKLDEKTHDLVKKLSSIAKANGFKQGDDIIAISYLPSIVFAMGGRSPGHPAFLTGSKAAEDYSKLALQFAETTRLRKAFVLLTIDTADAADILSSRGLNFPDEYRNIGTVDYTSAYGAKASYSLWKHDSQ